MTTKLNFLLHEVFHVLADGNGIPVFKKGEGNEAFFNELMSDHFAANALIDARGNKNCLPSLL